MPNLEGRFRLYPTVPVRPGCCFICRGTNGPFVDTKGSIPYEGAIYVCKTCVEGMHNTLEIPVAPVEDRFEEGFLAGKREAEELIFEGLADYVRNFKPAAWDSSFGSNLTAGDLAASQIAEGHSEELSGANFNDASVVEGQPGSNDANEPVIKPGSKPDSKSGRPDLSGTTGGDDPILNF